LEEQNAMRQTKCITAHKQTHTHTWEIEQTRQRGECELETPWDGRERRDVRKQKG